MLGKRFHKCLKEQSENKEFCKLTDKELVHQVCRKERLTFFNFLRMNTTNGSTITEESIKEMINREYGVYFQRDTHLDIYKGDGFVKKPAWNEVNRKFRLNIS
jgi:hypothetical protein